jgi:bisphosphoglycerate-independent phosphoglycerate mutase (AlkP superfamily)
MKTPKIGDIIVFKTGTIGRIITSTFKCNKYNDKKESCMWFKLRCISNTIGKYTKKKQTHHIHIKDGVL